MNLKQLNVLLADDDRDDCNFFKKALDALELSTRLTVVSDGEQLMQLLADAAMEPDAELMPDVLFLDINMPRKNGLECLSEMKRNEKLKDLPVIIFSTSNSQDKINLLFKNGAHVYVHKPGSFSQLKEVIYHALPIAVEKKSSNGRVKYILNA